MRLLSALAAGLCAFLLVAVATGQTEALRLRLPRTRKAKLSRTVWLRQAGVNVSPAAFWAVSAGCFVAALVLCWAAAGSLLVGLVPAVCAGLGPRAWFGRLRAVRLGLVVAAWPEAIGELRSFVAVRGSMHGAILDLAESGPPPMRDAFSRYKRLAALSSSSAALSQIQAELADPVSDKMLTLMRLAVTQGQAVTMTLLADQAVQVAADLRTAAEIRISQHEARLVNRVALVAPWAILLLLCAGEAGYRDFYASSAAIGPALVAGFFSLSGLAITTYLGREAMPIRVLGAAPSPMPVRLLVAA